MLPGKQIFSFLIHNNQTEMQAESKPAWRFILNEWKLLYMWHWHWKQLPTATLHSISS